MRTTVIDLNADLGEECGDDVAMLGIVTSANIACGVHAGDADTMRETVVEAVRRGVAIGAHVSYPDREHFGRRDMKLPASELTACVSDQIRALDAIARECGGSMRYVKAHGALYNRMAGDVTVAEAVFRGVEEAAPGLPLLTLPGCAAMRRGRELGLTMVGEAFADRAYDDEGRLVPRDRPGAVLTDAQQIAERCRGLMETGRLASLTGVPVRIDARSLCVHGDTPDAVTIASVVRETLERCGIALRAFA